MDVVAEAIGGRFDVIVDMQEELLSSAQVDLKVIESLKEKDSERALEVRDVIVSSMAGNRERHRFDFRKGTCFNHFDRRMPPLCPACVLPV